MVDWNLIETTRGQCSKHKGKGNRKKKTKNKKTEIDRKRKWAERRTKPLLSALRSLSLCWRKKKGDGETWPDIPKEK